MSANRGPRRSPAPSTRGGERAAASATGRVLALVDGARVRVRPIRPGDRDRLLDGFAHLGPESRYRRFLSPTPELAPRLVDYLTRVDHHDHEALVALDAASGEGVGVARFIRSPGRARRRRDGDRRRR